VHGESGAAGADPALFLGDDDVVTEVVDTRSAVLLGYVEAEQPGFAGLEPELARHDAVGIPLLAVGLDFLFHEGPDGPAEVFVFGLEQVTHR